MGCCQANLSSVNHPVSIDKVRFVDGIKQESIQSHKQNNVYINNNQIHNKTQNNQEQFIYSIHQFQQSLTSLSKVSILNQVKNQNIIQIQKSIKKVYLPIHPENQQNLVFLQQQYKINKIQTKNHLQNSTFFNKNPNNRCNMQSHQQIKISRIQLFKDITNSAFSGHQSTNKLIQFRESNKELLSIKNLNQNNIVNCKQDNLSSRSLFELHNDLSTMIVMWDKMSGKRSSRLRIEEKKVRTEDEQWEQKQQIHQNINQKQQQEDQQQQQQQSQKQLKNIWNDDQDLEDNKQSQKQSQQNHNIEQKINHLKQEFIIGSNANYIKEKVQPINQDYHISSKQHHQNQKQQCILQNKKIKQKIILSKNNSTNVETHQGHEQNFNDDKQNYHNQHKNIITKPPLKQQLQLNLVKLNLKQKQTLLLKEAQKQQQQQQLNKISNVNQSQQQDSQPSDDEYSKCLLSDPSRFLNLSLREDINQQKEQFYFGNQCQRVEEGQQLNLLSKWQQQDRKAFQIKDEHLAQIANNLHHKLQILQVQDQSSFDNKKTNNLLMIILSVIKKYNQLNKINLVSYKVIIENKGINVYQSQREKLNNQFIGFRTFYNGTKRMWCDKRQFHHSQIHLALAQLYSHFYSETKNPAEIIYNITGWIPQQIIIQEITNFEGVFERLNNNFKDGNTIITFTGKNNQSWGLKNIDIQKKNVELYGRNQKQQLSSSSIKYSSERFQEIYSWEEFIEIVHSINVNWNPLIYDYTWKTQNFFMAEDLVEKNIIHEFDQNYISDKSNQFLLKIPPNDEDIQLRVLLETHYQQDHQILADQPLIVELYDFQGTRINSSLTSIRKLDKNRYVYSDVLIFQSSKQKNQYVLVVRPVRQIKNKQILKYTFSIYSFFEVGLTQIPMQRVIQQKLIKTFMHQSHCGYGINSPHFLNNFYIQLKVPPLEKIKVFVEMPRGDCKFQLNLVSNPESQENLTRLNLENILGDIVTSEEFENGKGYLQIQSKFEQYFLIITNHTSCKGDFRIILQILQKQEKCLDFNKMVKIKHQRAKQSKLTQKLISTKQKYFYQDHILQKQFKWSPLNTGPRKRLKSNTHSGYQNLPVFKDFFKNPFIDFKIQKQGKYQFSVVSDSYKQLFNSLDNLQDKNDIQPPTISLSILKIKRQSQNSIQNQTQFKIILDDAFYVPFGFGYWTKSMQFQPGQYRFIFPKMQKQTGVGLFTVYQIK